MPDDAGASRPLDARTFYVLLVLHGGPSHGYAIKQDVLERSRGGVDLDAGGLYRLIARLDERGWICPADAPADADRDDERRKYYGLTELGREALATEARRMASVVAQPEVESLATAG